MSRIVVLDYGSSNLRSVTKALEFVADEKQHIEISDNADQILAADRVVFPGQGAVGQCMQSLKDKALDNVISECIRSKPFLGICLGLQSLMEWSEEDGGTEGLGIIKGRVLRFPDGVRDNDGQVCKIPHMGWNQVKQQKQHPLWRNIDDNSRFYFVHSYYVQAEQDSDIAATADYAVTFTAAIARDNIFATQFHPEKSQQAGLALLKNFLDWQI